MSYQLAFWKYKTDGNHPHQKTYERLIEGELTELTEALSIQDLREEVKKAFTDGWTQLDQDTFEAKGKSFQLFTTEHFALVDCGGMEGEEMNEFIDIGAKFDCRLYDPQTNQRYEG